MYNDKGFGMSHEHCDFVCNVERRDICKFSPHLTDTGTISLCGPMLPYVSELVRARGTGWTGSLLGSTREKVRV